MLAQILQRRQRGPNARVIGNAPVLHGYVEVDADQGGFCPRSRPPFNRLRTSGTLAPVHVADRTEAAHVALLCAGCGWRALAYAWVPAQPARIAHDLLQNRAVHRRAAANVSRNEGGDVRQPAGIAVL